MKTENRMAAFAHKGRVGVSWPAGESARLLYYVERFGPLRPQRVPVLEIAAGPLRGYYVIDDGGWINGSHWPPAVTYFSDDEFRELSRGAGLRGEPNQTPWSSAAVVQAFGGGDCFRVEVAREAERIRASSPA